MRWLLIILLLCVAADSLARTIEVGKGKPVATLRQAVQLSAPHDTILLHSGVYKEGNIVINKPICLIGIGNPLLDGENKHELLTITGSNIVVKGICFANSGHSSMSDYASVKIIAATNILIEGNVIGNSQFAIHIANSASSIVRDNKIQGKNGSEHLAGNGIHLWKCENMIIEGNVIRGHRDGIYFEFVTGSIIRKNVSELNIRYGLHFMFSHNDTYRGNTFRNNGAGVAVMYSKNVRMEHNIFDKNWGPSAYGMLLKDISNSYIRNNKFIQNTVAIHMEGSSRIEVANNIFRSNGWALKVQASCDDNTFHHNNFYSNSFDVATNGTKTLNKFYNNYWDKYDGYDLHRDGTGDVPYRPVSMYAMVVEHNPSTVILMRSFIVALFDRAEKAIPSLTPVNLVDAQPMIKPNKL